MRNINRIILHCSATPEGRYTSANEIRKWHVNGNGWSDIGYHYVIRIDGTIEKGRPISLALTLGVITKILLGSYMWVVVMRI